LTNNEIDLIENPPLDLVTLLQRDPNIVVAEVDPIGSHAFLRPNHAQPPFDRPAVRQALLHAINQASFLRAAYGDPRYWRTCHSYFGCGTPLETTAGSEPFQRPDMARARAALREAGYSNERVVIVAPSDIPHLNTHGQVAAQTMRQLGMNVDLQTMDWSTVTSRRVNRAPVADGGWSFTVTANVVMGLENPIINSFAGAACERSPFGWPCDERIERLRTQFMTAGPEEQRRIAAELNRLYYEVVPYYILGQYRGVTAYRRNLSGVLQSQARLYWNIRKN
jgi:peptide/nickel transport system substrate-binding protein